MFKKFGEDISDEEVKEAFAGMGIGMGGIEWAKIDAQPWVSKRKKARELEQETQDLINKSKYDISGVEFTAEEDATIQEQDPYTMSSEESQELGFSSVGAFQDWQEDNPDPKRKDIRNIKKENKEVAAALNLSEGTLGKTYEESGVIPGKSGENALDNMLSGYNINRVSEADDITQEAINEANMFFNKGEKKSSSSGSKKYF